jgi:hypothetical protein
MSKAKGRLLGWVSLNIAILLAGGSCASGPVFHTDKPAFPCSPPANYTISVDDLGGVSSSHSCVEISQTAGHSVKWTSGATKDVSIAFVLTKDQAIPFQRMSCSKPDSKGARLCILIDCPAACRTAFAPGYRPVDPDPNNLNYYAYSPGVTDKLGGGTKQGGDPGILIKR